MGTIRHSAIIVTSWEKALIQNAYKQACKIFEHVSILTPEVTNGYVSFYIPPNGSKQGWPESSMFNGTRAAFINWCKAQAYTDGSNSLQVVEISYGDLGKAKIENEI